MQINLNFHKKGFALGLLLKVRVFGTRKWPVTKSSFIVISMGFLGPKCTVLFNLSLLSVKVNHFNYFCIQWLKVGFEENL